MIRFPIGIVAAVCLRAVSFAAQADPAEELLKQAIGLHQAGNVEGAIDAYRKYLAIRPDSVPALSNLGAVYSRAGRYPDAAAQYRQALKIEPGNALVEMNLGLAYYKSGQIVLAAETFEKVHASVPNEPQPTMLLADCWLSLGKDRAVVDLMAPLADRHPDDLAIAYLFGTALARDQQIARAQTIINRIIRNGDTAEARLLLGTAELQAQDYAAALADLKKATELNPALPDVYSYFGQALLRTGDPQAATEAFRKALAANPNDFGANLQLAVLLKEENKTEEARACLRRALLSRPSDPSARYQVAALDLQEGHAEEARAGLEELVKETPDFSAAHVALATVYYRLKRKPEGDRERAIVQKLNAQIQAKQQQGIDIK